VLLASLDRIVAGRISAAALDAGSRAYARGATGAARRYLGIAARAAPSEPRVVMPAAQAALDAKDAPMALRLMDHAARLVPHDFALRARAIYLRYSMGDVAEARRRGEQALADSGEADPGEELMALVAGMRMPGPNYQEVLADIHALVRPRIYLEIGVSNGLSLAHAGQAQRAIGIDPAPELRVALPPCAQVFRETSDEFFGRRDVRALCDGHAIDLAFIDGMHQFEFALRDFINVERHCAPGATILMHDCYPLDRRSAQREQRTEFWSGDIWRALLALKKYRPDLRIATIACTPTGLCVVRGLDPASRVLAERYDEIVGELGALDYGVLAQDQAGMLNLVPNDADTLRRLLQRPAQLPAAAAPPAGAQLRLGLSHLDAGRTDQAIACFHEALALQPQSAEAHFNLGNAYRSQRLYAEAVASYGQALVLAPDFPDAHVNLGGALLEQGEIQEALACFRKAVVLAPELPEAQYNLGAASFRAGDLATARSALTQYLRAQPDDREALIALGEACSRSNALDEAADSCERILARNPADASAHNLLGNVRRNQARHAEAIAHYELAIRHDPNPVVAFQNLLFCLLCAGSTSAADVYARHVEFARRFEPPPPPAAERAACDPERRLRIGYVSPDFRSSVVGHYMQPILEHHERAAFEAHCYAIGPLRDAVTERIASLADGFHDVHRLSDNAIANRIRADGIDVLVDLCGHGPGNRILVFARRPAPVAVSYLDYSATTGLASIDYRLTTEDCDPTGVADPYYSERLLRLAGGYWTYNPSVRLPVTPLPAQSNGHLTFGSFNLYYRITDEVLDLWGRVLASVPRSRLLIVSVAAGSAQARLLERLGRAGVAPERVTVHGVVSYERYH
jgi:predicted O-linked N-acetylglucosamine transferase (SPINDLY family)